MFCAYAFIVGSTNNADGTATIVRVSFAVYFPLFLIMGFCFSSGIYMATCMQDKKTGMRSMLKAIGVTTLPYFTGLFLADFVIALIPNLCFTIILLAMNSYLMPPAEVFQWSALFVLFCSAVIVLAYLFHHLFDDPETSARYIALVFLLGFLAGPGILATLVAAAFQFEGSWAASLTVIFCCDPLYTFGLTTYNFGIKSYDPTW